jgi:protein-tyrosine-phosphatase/DNA-binding transcriptional ArsR family regulator
MPITLGDLTPGTFLGLVGHPLRWRLLAELGHSDRQVRELTVAVNQPQNLVSYHLRQLRQAGLVSMRRSIADRRDTYYTADLNRIRDLFAAVGAELHPGLHLMAPPTPEYRPAVRVLFLCTGNSSRSQIAETLLRASYGPAAEVFSAGSRPKAVHPFAIAVMATAGFDLATAQAKHLDLFVTQPFDWVITLCDRVREVCPEFPGARRAHWNVPDPSTEPDGYPAFERAATDIALRVQFLVHRIVTAATESMAVAS